MTNYAIMCMSVNGWDEKVSLWIWTSGRQGFELPVMNYNEAKSHYYPSEDRGETIVAVVRLE